RRWSWHEVGADTAVARLPRDAAVDGLERPDGRDGDPHPVAVRGVRDDRVEDEAAGARRPRRPGRMVRQALDVAPRAAAVLAPEQAGWPDARVQRVVRRRDVPDGRDLRAVVAVRDPLARLGPAGAEVLAPEHRRAVPLAATA